ncbi:MAG: 4-hydroxy-tetrahydrodipicolinate synthase [Bacteroidota bacterium]
MKLLSGTGVAVVTPFQEQATVDFPALRNVISYLIQGGVEYLVALGTTAEAATLSSAEQTKVIEVFQEETQGKIPLVLGVGGNNTAAICQKAREYEQRYRPAAFLSVSPYYNKPSQEGIYQHFKALCEATDTPIILYNVPGRTSSNISAQTCLRLARDFAQVVAIKEASGDMEQIMHILHQRPQGFLVLSGEDTLTLPMVALGCDGVISVTANAFPAEFSNMTRAALAHDLDTAQQLHYELLPFMDLNFREGNPTGVKALMQLLGVCGDHVRLPLVPGTSELRQAMDQALQARKAYSS